MREKLVGVFDGHNSEKKNKETGREDVESLMPHTLDECCYVGQNGRWNKPADTCYSFWNCGALDVSIFFPLSLTFPLHLISIHHAIFMGKLYFTKSP